MGWPFTAIAQSGMQCIYCGAVDPDSEDGCKNTGGRHTLMSYQDKQGQGQGEGEGPGENNYKDDTHNPSDKKQLKSSAKSPRWLSAWSQVNGRLTPRGRIHAVNPDDPDRTACNRSHAGIIEPNMSFGGEIVGHDHPFACRDCVSKLRQKTAHGLDQNDDTRVRHCPSCGAGDVWGGSSGDVHCDSCGMTFTVQAQPEYPQMPQNLQGMPLDINGDMDPSALGGQPGDEEAPGEEGGGGDGNPFGGDDAEAGDDPDDEDEEGSPADEEDQGKNGSSFPPKKSFYMTHQGNVVDRDNLINYLAIRHAPNPHAMIRAVKDYNTAE